MTVCVLGIVWRARIGQWRASHCRSARVPFHAESQYGYRKGLEARKLQAHTIIIPGRAQANRLALMARSSGLVSEPPPFVRSRLASATSMYMAAAVLVTRRTGTLPAARETRRSPRNKPSWCLEGRIQIQGHVAQEAPANRHPSSLPPWSSVRQQPRKVAARVIKVGLH